jgi:hypothetical protein
MCERAGLPTSDATVPSRELQGSQLRKMIHCRGVHGQRHYCDNCQTSLDNIYDFYTVYKLFYIRISAREYNWGDLLGRKSSGSGLETREHGRRDPSRWSRGTIYPLKLELTSTTSDGRSVSIVRSRTQATEFLSMYLWHFRKYTDFLPPISFATALHILVPFQAIFINISFNLEWYLFVRYIL